MTPGYHGRYLRIDPRPGRTDLRATRRASPPAFSRWRRTRRLDPRPRDACRVSTRLAPEAALVFALSPLVGSPLTTSAKFAVVGFSPLTGRVCDALSSSHFAIAAKRAGVDALVVAGACDVPSIVLIDGTDRDRADRRVACRPVHSGVCPREKPKQQIRAQHGLEWQVASIGPAGER